MFKLFSEPLPPARPEFANYSSCGCVYGHSRSARNTPAASPEPPSTASDASSSSSSIPDTTTSTAKQPLMPALTNARKVVLAEAHETRRRMDQCRDWASVVAGAARDAVHFNVEDSGQPYAGPRNLPSFYYDPDSHEPLALQSSVHACPTSPVSAKRELGSDSAVKQEPETSQSFKPAYRYVREEVLDEKPRRLDVRPLLEASALRRRRRDRVAEPSTARAQAHPYVRVKTEGGESTSRLETSTPATTASSHHSTQASAGPSRRVHTVGDRQRESSPALVPPHEPPESAPPSPSVSAADGGQSLAASRAPSPLPSTPHTPRAAVMTTAAETDSPQAPDQDSPQRTCDPLPSIGTLQCARDPPSSSTNGWKRLGKQRI